MKLWSTSVSRKEARSSLPGSDRKWLIISFIGVIGFLTGGVFFAGINGMSNTWQFLLGINLLILAGLFRIYQNGQKQKKFIKQKILSKDNSQNQFSLFDDASYLR